LFILNPTSLTKNNAKQLLATDATSCTADITLVSETRFKPHDDSSFSDIKDYVCFRYDRHKRRGGGVCLYIESHIKATHVQSTGVVDKTEYLWITFVIGSQTVFLCCCYHPPKPSNSSTELIDLLCGHINDFLSSYPNAVIILAGDLNKLDWSKFEVDFGMTQLVNQVRPTHGKSVIDKCLTNRPDLYPTVHVVSSLIDTKHKAVLIQSSNNTMKDQTNNSDMQTAAHKFLGDMQNSMRNSVKVGFHYPSSRPEFTGRVDGPRTRVHF